MKKLERNIRTLNKEITMLKAHLECSKTQNKVLQQQIDNLQHVAEAISRIENNNQYSALLPTKVEDSNEPLTDTIKMYDVSVQSGWHRSTELELHKLQAHIDNFDRSKAFSHIKLKYGNGEYAYYLSTEALLQMSPKTIAENVALKIVDLIEQQKKFATSN